MGAVFLLLGWIELGAVTGDVVYLRTIPGPRAPQAGPLDPLAWHSKPHAT